MPDSYCISEKMDLQTSKLIGRYSVGDRV
ncbi:MAG: hypothetical protein FD188_3471, partial [Ignavibacteria bacterium]